MAIGFAWKSRKNDYVLPLPKINIGSIFRKKSIFFSKIFPIDLTRENEFSLASPQKSASKTYTSELRRAIFEFCIFLHRSLFRRPQVAYRACEGNEKVYVLKRPQNCTNCTLFDRAAISGCRENGLRKWPEWRFWSTGELSTKECEQNVYIGRVKGDFHFDETWVEVNFRKVTSGVRGK